MFEVTDRALTPYRSICYITCEWSIGGATRASGVIVGVNDVLTAAHVVYDAFRGGYATKITVTPAADTTPFTAPYGSCSDVGVINTRTVNWDPNGDRLLSSAESQFDMAVIGMRMPIGNITGWLPVSSYSGDFYGVMAGYPAEGTGLMAEAVYADASGSYGVFDIASGLGAGASGGPLLWADPVTGIQSVVGVLSSGNGRNTLSSYAGLFGPGNFSWLGDVMASNDSVVTAAGVNLVGTSAADLLVGTAFGDTFRGGAGNDVIQGGGGTDTASFSGARAGYRVTHTGGSAITVTDTQPGRDGTDTLTEIERLAFSDMTINLEMGAKVRTVSAPQLKTLEELYVAFFNRVPDADGLAYWIDQTAAGQSLASIGDAFFNAALLYPSLTGYSSGMSNSDFVGLVYRNVLGRTDGGDAQGLAFWTGLLSTGVQTKGGLVNAMLASAHTFKGHASYGYVADLLDNKAAVAQLAAVDMGINYNTPEQSIIKGMEIAAAVTSTNTAAAISLIGISDGFSTTM